MSLRKEQKRKMQAVGEILRGCLQQSQKEITSQQLINQDIVQELLQTDVISNLHSVPTLKLIIYELILLISQQSSTKNQSICDTSGTTARISNILGNIQDVLKEIVGDAEDITLKSIDRRNVKQFIPNQRTNRNKQRLLSSYYHQFCSLIEEIQKNAGKTKSCQDIAKQSPDDALIDQLESLIFKKEAIIKNIEKENEEFKIKIQQVQEQLALLKEEHQDLFSQKLYVEQQRDRLKTDLLQIMRNEPESTIYKQQCSQVGKCFWNHETQKTIGPTNCNIDPIDNDLMMCLLSQAITIQALLQ